MKVPCEKGTVTYNSDNHQIRVNGRTFNCERLDEKVMWLLARRLAQEFRKTPK